MRPTSQLRDGSGPMATNSLLAAHADTDRHRGEERRHEHHRELSEARAESPSLFSRSQSQFGRLEIAIRTRLRPEHSLTDYACRLPDGRMGRVAVIERNGDWEMVCRMA
jgi:hypothetical protein